MTRLQRGFSLLVLAAAAMLPAGFCSTAAAASWVFLPSYYSHDPVAPVQVGPRYEGGPYYIRPQGQYIRGAWSHTQSSISVPNMGTDTYDYYESWSQVGGQY